MQYMRRRALVLAALLTLFFPVAIFAFTNPTVAAPGGNISAPVNVGAVNQAKNSNLGVNGLAVFGNTILQASSYLNWGATSGTNGYGIRDNAGVMEFKNLGGASWQSIQSIVSSLVSGQWTTSGTSIYYNTGNVGIGTASPGYKLDVTGQSHFTDYLYADTLRIKGGDISNTIWQSTLNAPLAMTTNGGLLSLGAGITAQTLNINSSGNVGIGTAGPTIKLAVGDSDTGLNSAGDGLLDVYSNNVNTMSVRSGNVGIGNTSPSTRLQVGDGGDGWTNGLTVHSNYPTIYLRDVDGRGAMIHNNGNILYFLRSCTTTGSPAGGNDWCTAANGWWPLYIDLENNNAVFGGNVYAFAFIYNSDERLKKNIQPLTDSLSKVLQLQGVTFNWKNAGMPQGTQIGFIAQDVEKVVPELVSTDASTTLKSVDYAKVTPLLVEAMKTQEAKIQAQQTEIEELKHAIDALQKNP